MKITPNPDRAFHTPTLTSWAQGVQARAHSTFRKHIYVSPFCLAVLGPAWPWTCWASALLLPLSTLSLPPHFIL